MGGNLLNNPKFKNLLIWVAIISGGILCWVYALYPHLIKPLLAFFTKSA